MNLNYSQDEHSQSIELPKWLDTNIDLDNQSAYLNVDREKY